MSPHPTHPTHRTTSRASAGALEFPVPVLCGDALEPELAGVLRHPVVDLAAAARVARAARVDVDRGAVLVLRVTGARSEVEARATIRPTVIETSLFGHRAEPRDELEIDAVAARGLLHLEEALRLVHFEVLALHRHDLKRARLAIRVRGRAARGTELRIEAFDARRVTRTFVAIRPTRAARSIVVRARGGRARALKFFGILYAVLL